MTKDKTKSMKQLRSKISQDKEMGKYMLHAWQGSGIGEQEI